jgi:hypothetical protein
VNNSVQFYLGSSGANPAQGTSDTVLNVDLQDLYGINLTSSMGNWTARAMATTITVNGQVDVRTGTLASVAPLFPGAPSLQDFAAVLAPTLGFDSCDTDVTTAFCAPSGFLHKKARDTFDYYSLGLSYDSGALFVVSEVAKLDTQRATIFSDAISGYVTAGYHYNQWTPYTTFAFKYDNENTAVLAANRLTPAAGRSASFGVRRELTSSLSAKLEANHFYNMENDGAFAGNPGSSSNAYTFALDAVF